MVDDTPATDGWLTLADAAAQLEISLDAMRRRMRRGDFPKRQIRSRHGLTWQIRLDGPPADPGTSLAPTVVPTVEVEPTVQALLTYLRERDQQRDSEVARLREDLARARADLVDHAGQLAEAREQLRALSAPAPSKMAHTSDSVGVSVEPTQTSSQTRERAPWWMPWRRVST